MKNEKSFIDPVTLSAIAGYATIIGGAASVIGFFMERDENRRMLDKLDEIKNYVKKIDADIQIIKQQNLVLLKQIDELPYKITAIVDEIVDNALIEERFSSLDRIINNYFLLPGGDDRYLINTQGWDELSDILNYIFRNENRVSTFFDIIKYCEFAIMVSDFQGTPFIKNMVENKLLYINDLFNTIATKCEDNIEVVLNDLNSNEFISSHNFNSDLKSLDELKWEPKPTKVEVETYRVRVRTGRECDAGERGGFCTTTYGYENRTRIIQSGIDHNKKRKRILSRVPKKIEILKINLNNYSEIRDFMRMLNFYNKTIEEDYLDLITKDKLILPDFEPFNNVNFEKVQFQKVLKESFGNYKSEKN